MRRMAMIGAAVAALAAGAGGVALAQSMGDGMMRGQGMMQGRGMGGDGPMAQFDRFDADGDGRVTEAEIEAFRAARFAELDADGNGAVSRQEFIDHAAARAGERAGAMFDRFDAGRRRRPVAGRDRGAQQGLGPDAARLIERFDADGDGAVSRGGDSPKFAKGCAGGCRTGWAAATMAGTG
jgi:hypothetical protein